MRNLYIDFDGVILDTIPILYKKIEDANVDKYNYKAASAFFASLNWEDLLEETSVLSDSINNIDKIIKSKKFNVAILTHVNSLNEAIAKVNYLRKYFADMTIIPVPKKISKTKMVQTKDAILIDDYSGNLREWEDEGGIGVRFNLELEDKGFPTIDRLDKIIDMY